MKEFTVFWYKLLIVLIVTSTPIYGESLIAYAEMVDIRQDKSPFGRYYVGFQIIISVYMRPEVWDAIPTSVSAGRKNPYMTGIMINQSSDSIATQIIAEPLILFTGQLHPLYHKSKWLVRKLRDKENWHFFGTSVHALVWDDRYPGDGIYELRMGLYASGRSPDGSLSHYDASIEFRGGSNMFEFVRHSPTNHEITPVPYINPADVNNDGFVDFIDFLEFAANFEKGYNRRYDFNQDGLVDFSDFLILVSAFDPLPGGSGKHFNAEKKK